MWRGRAGRHGALHLTAKTGSRLAPVFAEPDSGQYSHPTTVSFADAPAVESFAVYQPKPEKKLDPNFGYEIEMYTGEAALLVQAQLKKDVPAGEFSR